MTNVDARGRSCPEPVVMTRNALKSDKEGAVILVDNLCAAENITRYAGHEGYAAERTEKDGEWTLRLTRK